MDLPEDVASALEVFLETMSDVPAQWALTGSTSFAIQGVPVTPQDIDVQTNASGASVIERQFPDHVVDPVSRRESEHMRSHFGVLRLDGVRVEIMGDLQKRLSEGCWEPPVDITDHRQYERWRGHDVPVLSLGYEATAYERLGRAERAERLREFSQS